MPARKKSARRRSKSESRSRKMPMNNRPNNNNQPKKSRRGKSGSKKGRKGRSRKKGERVGKILWRQNKEGWKRVEVKDHDSELEQFLRSDPVSGGESNTSTLRVNNSSSLSGNKAPFGKYNKKLKYPEYGHRYTNADPTISQYQGNHASKMAKEISKLVKPSSSRNVPELNNNTMRFGVETISCKNSREKFNKLVNDLTDDINAILNLMINEQNVFNDAKINKKINKLYQNLQSKYRMDKNLYLPQYKECQDLKSKVTKFTIQINDNSKEVVLEKLLNSTKSNLKNYLENLIQ